MYETKWWGVGAAFDSVRGGPGAFVVDRINDMIVTGGENVNSAEVENAILQLAGVRMCAVIGVPDDKWGAKTGRWC